MNSQIKQIDLSVVKGDYTELHMELLDINEDVYNLSENEELVFVVKNKSTGETVINKSFNKVDMILAIEHSDTDNLSSNARYVYDIQYVPKDEKIRTIIKGKFVLIKEVGTWEDIKQYI